jgi:hypothetical protein
VQSNKATVNIQTALAHNSLPDKHIYTDFYEYAGSFFMSGICLAMYNMKRAVSLCLLTAGTRAVPCNPFGIGEKHGLSVQQVNRVTED